MGTEMSSCPGSCHLRFIFIAIKEMNIDRNILYHYFEAWAISPTVEHYFGFVFNMATPNKGWYGGNIV